MSYSIPAGRHRVITEIKNSQFIATVEPCASPEGFQVFLQDMRKEFPHASHHCWAYNFEGPGSSRSVGMSDDGEPKGTAGKPMLNVVLHASVGEVAVIVSRIYGGIRLGANGLVRAYSQAVQSVLADLPQVQKVVRCQRRFICGYDNLGAVELAVLQAQGQITQREFAEEVILEVDMTEAAWPGLQSALARLGRWLPDQVKN